MEPHQGDRISLKSPTASGCHRLPQIATMGRNLRMAQSKSSAKLNLESRSSKEATILHVEGTSKVIKILTDGISELTELESKENTAHTFAGESAEFISSISCDKDSDVRLKNKKVKKNSTSARVKKEALSSELATSFDVDNAKKEEKALLLQSPVNPSGDFLLSDSHKDKTNVSEDIALDNSCSNVSTIDLPDSGATVVNTDSAVGKRKRGRNRKNFTNVFEEGAKSELVVEGVAKTVPAKKLSRKEAIGNVTATGSIESAESCTTNSVEEGKFTKKGEMSGNDSSGAAKVHVPRCVLILPAEVPTESQLDKLLSMESLSGDFQHTELYKEGDLLWAKVCGHPYWPCMIAKCPFTKKYVRIKGLTTTVRSYHVQFFGNEAERGWINEASLMVFEGIHSFWKKAEIGSHKKTKKGKTAYRSNPFKINSCRKNAWNIAVEEIEGAHQLSKEERKIQYTFEYVFVSGRKEEKQFQKEEDSPSPLKPDGGRKRKRSVSEGETIYPQAKRKNEAQATPVCKTPEVVELSFDTYYSSHRSTVIEQHPEWDTSLVFEYLRQQWSLISGKKKRLMSKSKLCSPGNSQTKNTSPVLPRTSSATSCNQPVGATTKRGRKLSTKLPVSLTVDGLLPDSVDGTINNSSALNDQEKQGSKLSTKLFLNESTLPSDSCERTKDNSSLLGLGQPRKRGKAKKVAESSPLSDELLVPNAAGDPVGEDGDVIVDLVSPKIAASALSARKPSQESDSGSEGKGKGLRENEQYELEIFKLLSTSKIERDNVCNICERNGNLLECSGSCGHHFHASCLQTESLPTENFKCAECLSGIHTCFTCKNADPEVKKCSVVVCGKFYHESCVRKHRLTRYESKGFICPLHTCASCAVDNVRNSKATKGRLYRCVRCPKAYHTGDFCVAAGCLHLAGSNIVCSIHFQPNKSLTQHSRLNITWCFSCSKGGTLLCCESCPAAFHAECVKVEKTPEGAWYCMGCEAGRKPLYGNIVWIKVGNYRWWPGEICHPRHVPLNIQEKPHQVGEFPVRFFGSHDYYWIHQGRVFLFQEGDKGSRDSSSKGLFKIYMRGVKEATEAFKLWTAVKAKKVEQEQERSDKKPGPYKTIKSNVPIGSVQIYKAELSEIPRCECSPDQEEPCRTDCLNRMMMYECHPNVCLAGDKCHNQRFQKREYQLCEPFRCEGRGWGLRCQDDIKKGQFISEYVGDLIDEEECKKRMEQAHEDNINNFYMLTMDKNRIIDAGPKGNFSRFMNHSCCPNLETQKWMVNGDIRVGLFALCDIPKGLELTFNYNLECLGNEKKVCACGSENCSGFLGVRPKTAAAAAYEKKVKEPKKKKRKKRSDMLKEYEDECFRCGEGGELVMCDKGNCPKVYHLQCLKLTKPPSGKWLCPWHHCDDCGKLSTSCCSECPNSYCAVHTKGNIVDIQGLLVCMDHTDLLDGNFQQLVSSKSEDTSTTPVINSMNNEVLTEVQSTGPLTDAEPQRLVNADANDYLPKLNSHSRPESYSNGCKKTVEKLLQTEWTVGNLESTVSVESNVLTQSAIPSTALPKPTHVGVVGSQRSQIKPRAGRGGRACRTKARYKAQLTGVPNGIGHGFAVPVTASVVGQFGAACDPAVSRIEESDDNDSITDLVIDIPS